MRTTFPDVFIGEPPRSLYAVRTQLAQGNYVKIGRILQKCLLQSQYILRINITKIIYIEFRILQKGIGGQLNCFYGLSLFSIRFKFRKFETCATGHSLQISHLGAIKNLLCNFALCKIAADGKPIVSFILRSTVRHPLESQFIHTF